MFGKHGVAVALTTSLATTVLPGCDLLFGVSGSADGPARDGAGLDGPVDAVPPVDANCSLPGDDDLDGIHDACDNYPHLGNQAQDDRDEDGVGDVCDPREDRRDTLVLFRGLGAGDEIELFAEGGAEWGALDGRLAAMCSGDTQLFAQVRLPAALQHLTVVAGFVLTDVSRVGDVSVWARITPTADPVAPDGLMARQRNSGDLDLRAVAGGVPTDLGLPSASSTLPAATPFQVTLEITASTAADQATARQGMAQVTGEVPSEATAAVGIGVDSLAGVDLDYLVVYTH